MNISSFYSPLHLPKLTRQEKKNLDEARKLAASSHDLTSQRKFIQALKALDMSLYCLEAYNLLAETDVEQRRKLCIYQRGEEAGRKLLGEDFLQQSRGHLPVNPDTRPYLQSLAGISACCMDAGDWQNAVSYLFRIVELTGDDVFNMRRELMERLIEGGEYELARPLALRFSHDFGASWLYDLALEGSTKPEFKDNACQYVQKHIADALLARRSSKP